MSKKKVGPPSSAVGPVEPLYEIFETQAESTAAAPPTEPTKPAVAVANSDEEEGFLIGLRIDQSYAADSAVGVRKPLLTVPVRKPGRSDFCRVHPNHTLDCYSVELKSEGEIFFVTPGVAPIVAEFVEPVRLHLAVTRQGVVFLWPCKLPRDDRDRRGEAWRRSALDIVDLARKTWVRTAADMGLGAYVAFAAVADLGEPAWPAETWALVVKTALRDRLIDREDHAVVRQLLGQE